MPGTHGGAGQSDAHRLGEFAHLQAVFVQRFGEGLLDGAFAEISQIAKLFDQAAEAALRYLESKISSPLFHRWQYRRSR